MHQSTKGPNPSRASGLSQRRGSIGIATLVLDSHRCRIHRFLTCDAFESGENASIVHECKTRDQAAINRTTNAAVASSGKVPVY
jgi:hypothetical protein